MGSQTQDLPKKKKSRGSICANQRCQKDRPGRTASCQWRKGWKDADGVSVILCNACGVRFSRGHWCPYCYFIYKSDDQNAPGNPWLHCVGCRRRVHQQCHLSDPSRTLPAEGESFFCPFCVENGVTSSATRSSGRSSSRSTRSTPRSSHTGDNAKKRVGPKSERAARALAKRRIIEQSSNSVDGASSRSIRSKRSRSKSISTDGASRTRTRSKNGSISGSNESIMGSSISHPTSESPITKARSSGQQSSSIDDTEEDWSNAQCLCKSGVGGLMLDCDGCGKYFHPNCVGLNKTKLPSTWFCPFCRISSTPAPHFPPGTPLDRSPNNLNRQPLLYNRMYNSFNSPSSSKFSNPLTMMPGMMPGSVGPMGQHVHNPGWNHVNQYPTPGSVQSMSSPHMAAPNLPMTVLDNPNIALMLPKDSKIWQSPIGHPISKFGLSQNLVNATKPQHSTKIIPPYKSNDLNLTLAPGESIEGETSDTGGNSNSTGSRTGPGSSKQDTKDKGNNLNEANQGNTHPEKTPVKTQNLPHNQSNKQKILLDNGNGNGNDIEGNNTSNLQSSSNQNQNNKPSASEQPLSPTSKAFRELLGVPTSSFSSPTIPNSTYNIQSNNRQHFPSYAPRAPQLISAPQTAHLPQGQMQIQSEQYQLIPNFHLYFTQAELTTLESLLGCPLSHLFQTNMFDKMTPHQVVRRLSLLISIKKRNTQSELVSVNHIESLLSSLSGRGPSPAPTSFEEAEEAAKKAGEKVTLDRKNLEDSLSNERTAIVQFWQSFENIGHIPVPVLRQLWSHVMNVCFPSFQNGQTPISIGTNSNTVASQVHVPSVIESISPSIQASTMQAGNHLFPAENRAINQ